MSKFSAIPNTTTEPTRTIERLTVIGFVPATGFKYFHDASGVLIYVWPDGSIAVEINDPNWPEVPAVMQQLAEIATPDDPEPDYDICDEADAAVSWYELTHDRGEA